MTASPSWIFISNSIHFGGKKENRQPDKGLAFKTRQF
jgi:hypothetical protein